MSRSCGGGRLVLTIIAAIGSAAGAAEVLGAEAGVDKVTVEHQPQKAVRELGEAYVRNRDSFEQFVCRYDLFKYFGQVNLEDVYRNRRQPDARATGLCVRRGTYRRQQTDISDADYAKYIKKGGGHHFSSKDILANKTDYILVHRHSQTVNFWKLKPDAERVEFGPFSWGGFSAFGRGNVDSFFRKGSRVQSSRRLEPLTTEIAHAAVPVSELMGFEYETKNGKSTLVWQFFLAPKQGHLPIVARLLRDGMLQSSVVITDVQEFKGNRFFPMRSLYCRYDAAAANKVTEVIETKVATVEVDQPLAPSLFQIEVKQKATYIDLRDPNSQMPLPGPRTLSLNDLDELYRLAGESSKRRKEDPNAVKFGQVLDAAKK